MSESKQSSKLMEVRSLQLSDWDEWCVLWREYLSFYETERPPEVFKSMFDGIMSGGDHEFHGFVAVDASGVLVGLVHYLFHRSGWSIENKKCYLHDLFVSPTARGSGAGRCLIEAVYAKAEESHADPVYWLTHECNTQARGLYDKVGVLTPFVQYVRKQSSQVTHLAPQSPPPSTTTVRMLQASDWEQWCVLWRGYLTFYETELPPEVFSSTFDRMLSGDHHEFQGLVAVDATGMLIGLVHYLFHLSWCIEGYKCYLQDLFVSPAARGSGAGRALIEAVYAKADERNASAPPPVYWFTQTFNLQARILYD